MQDLDHARLMLTMAGKDLAAIKAMKDADDFSDEIFGFHAQQAVEKSVKAWLSIAGIKYLKNHDLDRLFALLTRNNIPIPEVFSGLKNLTDFAIVFRYEAVEKFYEPLDRPGLTAKIEAFYRHVAALISS